MVGEVIEDVGVDGGDRFAAVEPFVVPGDRVLDVREGNPRSGLTLRTDDRDLRELWVVAHTLDIAPENKTAPVRSKLRGLWGQGGERLGEFAGVREDVQPHFGLAVVYLDGGVDGKGVLLIPGEAALDAPDDVRARLPE